MMGRVSVPEHDHQQLPPVRLAQDRLMPLQIQLTHERLLVTLADRLLAIASIGRRVAGPRRPPEDLRRILLLRIERIGDLVMTLDAIRDVRALAPDAEIDLVVGSWNHPLAAAIPVVDRAVSVDAAWLARDGQGFGLPSLLRSAWRWRDRRYDLAINFEPDVRSNLIAAASGAARTAGWKSGGGGPVLDIALDFDTTAHTSSNASRLVREAFGRTPPVSTQPLVALPDGAVAAAATILGEGVSRPLVGVHVNGGRAIKQWEPRRFAEVAAAVADSAGGTIVATGSPADRPFIAELQSALAPRSVIDASRASDLLVAAAILSRLDVSSPATPGRCILPQQWGHRWSPSSDRPIPSAMQRAAISIAWFASTCPAAPATASGDRRHDVSVIRRTA